jgi:hypothetical protein
MGEQHFLSGSMTNGIISQLKCHIPNPDTGYSIANTLKLMY